MSSSFLFLFPSVISSHLTNSHLLQFVGTLFFCVLFCCVFLCCLLLSPPSSHRPPLLSSSSSAAAVIGEVGWAHSQTGEGRSQNDSLRGAHAPCKLACSAQSYHPGCCSGPLLSSHTLCVCSYTCIHSLIHSDALHSTPSGMMKLVCLCCSCSFQSSLTFHCAALFLGME